MICDCKEHKCFFFVGETLDNMALVKTLDMDYREELRLGITGFSHVEVSLESSAKGHISRLKRGKELSEEHVVSKRMRSMWANRDFTDAVVRCGDRPFPVHRSVLAQASPVFARMFQPGFREGFKLTLGCRSSSHSCQHGKGDEEGSGSRAGSCCASKEGHEEGHEEGSQEACHEGSNEEGHEGRQEEVSS